MEELKVYRDSKEPKSGKKRLHIDASIDHYERIRIAAFNRGITITRYVMGVVLKQVLEDEQYQK